MKSQPLCLFVVVVAASLANGCGPMSADDARAAWSSVGRSIDPSSGREQALSVNFDTDTSLDCLRSGRMKVEANVDAAAEDGDLQLAFDLGLQYFACQPDEDTIDGNLDYVAAFSSTGSDVGRSSALQYTYEGTLQVTKADGTVQECVIDATGTANSEIEQLPGAEFHASADVDYQGTICGQDADVVAGFDVTD